MSCRPAGGCDDRTVSSVAARVGILQSRGHRKQDLVLRAIISFGHVCKQQI